MNDGTILDLAKKSGLVSQTYTIESGNVSWLRLKAFAELVSAHCDESQENEKNEA